MVSEWRKFEELIARIEKAVAPSGAVVKSPDKIPDNVSGTPREVDASIRYKIGTCPVLITIECRHRGGAEDVTWIEQLAEKKRSVGAAITIAVSSSGFSKPAVAKAAALGIQVRTLREATVEELIGWLKIQHVDLDLAEFTLSSLAIELYDAKEGTELSSEVQDSFRELGIRAKIFERNTDGRRYHVENLLIEWDKRNGSFFPEDLPEETEPIFQTLHQPFERGSLQCETTHGKLDVQVVHIKLASTRKKSRVPFSRLFEYSSPESPLIQTAESQLMPNLALSLHRDLTSGQTHVGLSPIR